MVQIVRYLNGTQSHVTLPSEYWILILSGIHLNPVFRCWVFRWLLYIIQILFVYFQEKGYFTIGDTNDERGARIFYYTIIIAYAKELQSVRYAHVLQ